MIEKVINPFIIEDITPVVDGGKYPVKREVGNVLDVTATVFRDGHDVIRVLLKYREKYTGDDWSETVMECVNPGLDRWRGSFHLLKNTRYEYTIEAYSDTYNSWLRDTNRKLEAGHDIESELIEGDQYLAKVLDLITHREENTYTKELLKLIGVVESLPDKMKLYSDSVLIELVHKYANRDYYTVYEPYLEVVVDRIQARYAAWYEMFARSQGTEPNKSATFYDCIKRLPEIKDMGFDVIYLPPIHPIGFTKRKGPNNSLVSKPGDPGSPYAIGNETGGHKAVEPGLGTIDDFIQFEKACKEHGMEVALDFAINCSPDHPYVKDHPEWFFVRPDGTIKYAENPPKKYEDIYPLNFFATDGKYEELWQEMKDVLTFWIERGVRIFRVDNPHTKPVPFWHWLITDLQKDYPDVLFLSEAFTRPEVVKILAKVGFTQSYTYFTWRNFKGELTEYLTELTQTDVNEYLRGNFFANTPDILPTFLQQGGRPAFMIRFVLACTLSSVYGIYNGFELCENAAVAGKEEYLHSEKYEYKVWDWNRPGNIKDYITKVNRIRKENKALHYYKNLRFYESDDENILFYGKATPEGDSIILIAVNLDPFNTHSANLTIPAAELGIPSNETYQLNNLMTGKKVLKKDNVHNVTLNPEIEPAFIFRLERWLHKEKGFDYFGM